MGLRPNLPDVQVRNGGIPRSLNQFTNFLGNVRISLIQQHTCGGPHQGPCPPRNNDGADELDLVNLGFEGVIPADTGRPAYHPAILLKLYIYGYFNHIQSSRRLEREAL